MSDSSSLKSKIMIFVVIILTLASGAGTGAVLSSVTKGKQQPAAQVQSTTTTEQAVTAEEKSAEDKKQEDENAKKLEEQKKADEAKAAEEQKKADEAKQAEAAKAQETADKNTSTAQAGTYPKGIFFETGVRIVENKQQEDAKTGTNIISSGLAYSTKSNGVTFKVAASGTNLSVPYKATIHLKSGDVVYKGTASSQLQSVAVASSKVAAGSKVVIDYEATYKGKVYKFTNSFTRSK